MFRLQSALSIFGDWTLEWRSTAASHNGLSLASRELAASVRMSQEGSNKRFSLHYLQLNVAVSTGS
jgi:hypothetical protein